MWICNFYFSLISLALSHFLSFQVLALSQRMSRGFYRLWINNVLNYFNRRNIAACYCVSPRTATSLLICSRIVRTSPLITIHLPLLPSRRNDIAISISRRSRIASTNETFERYIKLHLLSFYCAKNLLVRRLI